MNIEDDCCSYCFFAEHAADFNYIPILAMDADSCCP